MKEWSGRKGMEEGRHEGGGKQARNRGKGEKVEISKKERAQGKCRNIDRLTD